jgi:IclR family acetate operon transcriptional repressor
VIQLSRALDILELLGERGELQLHEISKAVDTPRASTYRLLATLARRGYVEHVPEGHVYRLGAQVTTLSERVATTTLADLAAPALAHLRARTGESVNLGVLIGNRIVYASTMEGFLLPRMPSTVGAEIQPHSTAIGKAILAHLPPERRNAVLPAGALPAFTGRTITDSSRLADEFSQIVERGYAVDCEESDPGVTCIAAVILRGDEPVAALSISGLSARIPEPDWPRHARELRGWCREITQALGHRGEAASR